MKLQINVEPAGKATAQVVLSQKDVDKLRGEPGRGRVNFILRYEKHEFRSSISIYRGAWMFVVNKAMRSAGLLPGANYSVEILRDFEPKIAEPAADVMAALKGTVGAHQAWSKRSRSYRREKLKHIEGAKRVETRERRLAKLCTELLEG